jgi:acetolactate synthase-1/2/3 large subunit
MWMRWARAVSLIRAAERPMIFVGSGAADAANEVRELAERLDAPVVCFRGGQGVSDARHELSHPLPGASCGTRRIL